MDRWQAGSVRGVLENELARVTTEIDRLLPGGVTRDSLGYGNHMADDATEVFEQAKGMALLRHLEELRTEIAAALRRVDHGTYGKCEVCGGAIGTERLRVLPYARLCMGCKRKLEASPIPR